jgi:hypothetical protein
MIDGLRLSRLSNSSTVIPQYFRAISKYECLVPITLVPITVSPSTIPEVPVTYYNAGEVAP